MEREGGGEGGGGINRRGYGGERGSKINFAMCIYVHVPLQTYAL